MAPYYETVCVCLDIKEPQIEKILKEHKSITKLSELTQACTKCRLCLPRVEKILKKVANEN